MAYIHVIDSGSQINCPYGRVGGGSNNTARWTPNMFTCGLQTASLPDYDSRMHIVCCSGATVSVSGVSVTSESLIVVDGC